MANSRVYESLNHLISKGLISYNIQKEGKHFQAVNPKRFKEIEEERKKKVEKILPQLSHIMNTSPKETISVVYEDFSGFKTAFQRIIGDCPEKETIYILGFSQPNFASRSLRTFINNMNLRSAQKKQKLMILLDQSAKNNLGKDRKKELNTEVRYMPKGYISPAAIDTFGEYVYIFLWEEKPFVFMIKNQKIAESFQQYFKFLWSLGKK